jgi:helix-turn-helix, Psq domain
MPASSFSPLPGVTVPHDILSQSQEERIQLAIAAIQESGTKANGDPRYSARQAEKHFGVPRSTLGLRLKGIYYFTKQFHISD